MSLGYYGLGPDSFLGTMSKQILQVETKTSWSGTRQILGLGPKQSVQEHSWLVDQVNLGQDSPGQLTKNAPAGTAWVPNQESAWSQTKKSLSQPARSSWTLCPGNCLVPDQNTLETYRRPSHMLGTFPWHQPAWSQAKNPRRLLSGLGYLLGTYSPWLTDHDPS